MLKVQAAVALAFWIQAGAAPDVCTDYTKSSWSGHTPVSPPASIAAEHWPPDPPFVGIMTALLSTGGPLISGFLRCPAGHRIEVRGTDERALPADCKSVPG